MPVSEGGVLIVAEPRDGYAARPPLVVDCSVIASVLFDEADRVTALAALTGRDLFAPGLIDHEFVSVAVKKSPLGPSELIERALADFARLQLTRLPVDSRGQWQLALTAGISAYDAAYLWLAADLRAPLATFDRRLGEAARRHLEAH